MRYGNHKLATVGLVKKCLSFKIMAPTLTGMNMKNEKSLAAFCSSPPNIPPVKVEPLLEIPGNNANN